MAWLQQNPSGHFYIGFCFAGRTFRRSLKTTERRKANSKKVRLKDTNSLIESGRIDLPSGVDIPTFLLGDGKKVKKQTHTRRIAERAWLLHSQFGKHYLEDCLITISLSGQSLGW